MWGVVWANDMISCSFSSFIVLNQQTVAQCNTHAHTNTHTHTLGGEITLQFVMHCRKSWGVFNLSDWKESFVTLHSFPHFTLPTAPLSFVLVHLPLCCHHTLTSSPHSHSHSLMAFPSLSCTHSLSSSLRPSHSHTHTHTHSHPHTHTHTHTLPPLLQESAVVFVEGADHNSLSISPEDFARYATRSMSHAH